MSQPRRDLLFGIFIRKEMVNMEHVLSIIAAILGTGGITAVITALLSARKYRAEARAMEQQTDAARKSFENEMTEKLNRQFMELAEIHKREYDAQRIQTKLLETQVADLKDYINQLVSWIMTDNASYRNFLETKITQLVPDFEFPKTTPFPRFEDGDNKSESAS